jgi:exosortase
MTTDALERPPTAFASLISDRKPSTLVPYLITGLAFMVLFWQPMTTLVRDWWSDPEAGHGLLLGPLAIYLAWKKGTSPDARGQAALGLFLIAGSVLLRYLSGLAAELFTMRLSLLGAAAGLVVMYLGFRQLIRWWLPVTLLVLSIPLPTVVTGTLALPLQFQASRLGAAMLEWRHVPVQIAGNVINIPGNQLFVTEACSGLRSLTALVALGVLIGGLWLKHPVSRVMLLAITIPVAIMLNGVRVFLTGFLIFFVDKRLGEGFMHLTEGWIIFVVAFVILGGTAWIMTKLEDLFSSRRTPVLEEQVAT